MRRRRGRDRCGCALRDAAARRRWGELRERELLRVRLAGADGDSSASARPRRWSPTTASRSARCAARSTPTRAVLRDAADATRGPASCWTLPRRRDLPQALAAVDLALWDRAGRRAGRPVARAARDGPRDAVPVNATIGAEDRAGAARAAAAAAPRASAA